VENATDWKYTGAVVPGYPDLHPKMQDFRSEFWRLHRLLPGEFGSTGEKDGPPPAVGGYS